MCSVWCIRRRCNRGCTRKIYLASDDTTRLFCVYEHKARVGNIFGEHLLLWHPSCFMKVSSFGG